MTLEGKFICITGASGGIGKEVALEVSKRGATPILMARSLDKLEEVAAQIKSQYNKDAVVIPVDVGNLEQVQEAFSVLLEKVPTVHCLVNNAGFGIFDEVLHMNLSDMEKMFEVNVFGLMACTKLVLPTMMEQNNGHIINIASQAGKLATPKSSVYSATKHAVLGFTNSLRMELHGTNIYVTAVNPGPIRTNFFQVADASGDYASKVDKWMLDSSFVAKKIVDAMFTGKREINLPGWMNATAKAYQLFPTFVEKVAGSAFRKK
ncbi:MULTISPECIES: SDR family NAD(P)-dependent oxidoreductase [Bacillus]|uniref:SDR family NAD(P)-dependent oxidoreductase n=1 Tax=Bacillus TaxID=1386 RepID=UPI000BB91CAC|nr:MULTISPECIES: SDR family oxidoreductase [Bacillus]